MIELRLGKRKPAVLLDRDHAEGAVAAGAGQDNADRILALIDRQRLEEAVDWAAQGVKFIDLMCGAEKFSKA